MRKIGQGVILIIGGCVGLLGFIAQIQAREWAMAVFLFLMMASAFTLGGWLVRKGWKEGM